MIITRILEKLFKLEPVICQSCEHLKMLLETERLERDKLIDKLTATEVKTETRPAIDYKALQSRNVPFAVKRQQLEQADKKRAEVLAEQARAEQRVKATEIKTESIEQLEKELGVVAEDNAELKAVNG